MDGNSEATTHEPALNGQTPPAAVVAEGPVEAHAKTDEPEVILPAADANPPADKLPVAGVIIDEEVVALPRRDTVRLSLLLAVIASCWVAYVNGMFAGVAPLAELQSKGFLIPTTPGQIQATMVWFPFAYLSFHLFRAPVSTNWFARWLDVVVSIIPLVLVVLGGTGELPAALAALFFVIVLSNINRAMSAPTIEA